MEMRLSSSTKARELVGQPTTCIATNPFMDRMHVYTVLKGGRMVNWSARSVWDQASWISTVVHGFALEVSNFITSSTPEHEC